MTVKIPVKPKVLLVNPVENPNALYSIDTYLLRRSVAWENRKQRSSLAPFVHQINSGCH